MTQASASAALTDSVRQRTVTELVAPVATSPSVTADPLTRRSHRAGSPGNVSPAHKLWRGRPDDPGWVRPGLLVLLTATAVLYLWGLGSSTGNSFYAAAVQAGTQSWKAMLFGSLDAGNAITVDKPALSLWPMEISGRLFGFNTWSMLVPQALEGVAAVALVYATVRRVTAPIYGLLAGLVLAVTPAAVLMFRFNNPDAMLALLLTAASYAVVRAIQAGSGRWLALAGLLVGLGFITKMGQALLVVPAFGLAYLLASPTGLGRRISHLLTALVVMVVGAGWYIALVDLWPAGSRPYIGGSTNNSMLELALGYNGIGRLFGNTAGNGGGGGGGGGSFGGATGLGRLFSSEMGAEISWLLPAALIALVAGLVLTRHAPRTDLRRAALVMFGGSLLVTALVFSYMQGVIHPYYTIAMAPSIGAVLALTGSVLWEQRATWTARILAAVLVETTVVWDAHLLGNWHPELKTALVVLSFVAVIGLLFREFLGRLAVVGVLAALLAGVGGSTAYAVSTASHPHSGSIPSAGPATSEMGGGGGPDSGSSTNTALTALLSKTTTRWAAATDGAGSSAPLQISSGRPVMAIGGFNGSDNAPTLAQFEGWVKAGDIAYYVSGGQGGGGRGGGAGGTSSSSEIAAWVAANYTATTVGGSTVYDLTS
jgi:4-amino-4-deoxy-L-arabinose transferase-like glycosyltransferase